MHDYAFCAHTVDMCVPAVARGRASPVGYTIPSTHASPLAVQSLKVITRARSPYLLPARLPPVVRGAPRPCAALARARAARRRCKHCDADCPTG